MSALDDLLVDLDVAWMTLAPAEAVRELTLRTGRNSGPAYLFEAWHADLIDAADLASLIGDIWTGAEYPESYVDQYTWIEMFESAGYTVDFERAKPPRKAIRLYRGAPEGWAHRMAWTSSRITAEWFARRFAHRGAVVWTSLVPPTAILAHITDRGEHEYVIDPTGIVIEAAR